MNTMKGLGRVLEKSEAKNIMVSGKEMAPTRNLFEYVARLYRINLVT